MIYTVNVGRLAVQWLRTDPSGLVRPLSPPSSFPIPQTSIHASELTGTQDGGSFCRQYDILRLWSTEIKLLISCVPLAKHNFEPM